MPKLPPPRIGLIGCGGIAATHLETYRSAGFPVTALYDRHPDRAYQLGEKYFPAAKVCESLERFWDCDFTVADLTPHPEDRVDLIEMALRHGRHVLSQKPLAIDLAVAERLISLAREEGVLLAVNQNGRFAPHVRYAVQAITAGLLGEVQSADVSIYWDHNWCADTKFDQVRHLLLYDFAIHWFDMVCCYFQPARPVWVTARISRTSSQKTKPALHGQVLVEFELPDRERETRSGMHGQACLTFRGDSKWCPRDQTVIVGSHGTLVSHGPNLNEQTVELHLPDGVVRPQLQGAWFNDGFAGAMGELICAIEESRRPLHDAETNLTTLELCFAAIASAEQNRPVEVGSVRRLIE